MANRLFLGEKPPTDPQKTPDFIPAIESASEPVQGAFRDQISGNILIIPPGKTRVLIGRADISESYFPDVDLDSLGGEHMGVSRRHAMLTCQANQIMLTDLNSTNFTFVNHQVLPAGQAVPIKSGDTVQFGQLVLLFENPS